MEKHPFVEQTTAWCSMRNLLHLVLLSLQLVVIILVFSQLNIFHREDLSALRTLLDTRQSLYSSTNHQEFESAVLLNNVDLLSHATIIFGKMPHIKVLNGLDNKEILCLSTYLDQCKPYYKSDADISFATYYPKAKRWLTFVYHTQGRYYNIISWLFFAFEFLFMIYLCYFLFVYCAKLPHKLLEYLSGSLSKLSTPNGSSEVLPYEQKVREAIRDKMMVLSSASHDIRTPVTKIKLILDAAQDNTDLKSKARIESELDKIVSCLAHVSQYIQTGDFIEPKNMTRVNLYSFLLTVKNEWEASHPDRIELNIEAPKKQVVRVHARLFRRVFDNLINNALDNAKNIIIHCTLKAQEIVIEVEDNGPGVNPADLERIFEPFIKGDPQSGTGLGLAISRRIVEAHGGTLTARLADSGGLICSLVLPVTGAGG